MRTKTLFLTALAVAAGVASSVAQSNVYSLNVVGYVNKVIPAGKFICLNTPLDSGTNTLDSLFANAPADNTLKVWVWNGAGYDPYTKRPTGWSGGAGPLVFNPGTAFFAQNTGANDITNTFVGNVIQGSNSIAYPVSFSLIGCVNPVAGLVQTGLGFPAVTNDKVWQFDVPTQSWVPFTRRATGWPAGEPTIDVGEGFFVQAVAAGTWTRVFNVQ